MVAEDISSPVAPPAVQAVELPDLTASARGKPLVLRTLDVIRDVQVKASAVLGSASVSVERLFALKEGEVLALDQAINAPIEVLIEGHLVAHGQIVVVGYRFGVLITGISEQ
jgi:flagellar motor switch protein FliN/FliY